MRMLPAAALAAAGLLAAVPAARAQQGTPADTVRLEEIVVTATRLPTPLAATTAAVTVITGEELRERGIATVADALRAVPGADVVETGPYGGTASLFLRGGESDYVRVLVDGVPLNQPGGALDLSTLTTDDVDRIEIVRGPASVLYGSDAVAGVVQIFTREGRRGSPPRWGARLQGGTFGSRDVAAGLAGGGYSLGWSRFSSDGIYAFNNQYWNQTANGALTLTPDSRTTARLAARYGDDVYHFPTDGSGNVVHHNQYQTGRQLVASLDLGRFFSPHVEGRLLLGGSEGNAHVDQEPNGPADTLGFYGFQSYDRLSRRSADLRANLYAGAAVLTAGAATEMEAERSWNASQSQFGPSSGSLVVSRWNRAYYAQAVVEPGPLSVTLGSRVDDNRAFGTFFTWRAGAAYRIGETKLRAAAGTAFKEPSFFENYATGYVTGNPGLKPERSTSWDAGLEQALWRGRLAVAATWFDQRFRDLIQYTATTPTPNGPNYYNIAAANASGLELEARALPLGRLALTARYTWLRTVAADSGYDGATFAQGRRLLRRPTHAGSLEAAWRFADRGSASAIVRYAGDRDDEDFSTFPGTRVILPAYTRVDLAGEIPIATDRRLRPGAVLTLKVENLFDARYQEILGFPARRRAAFVGVRLDGGL